MLSLLQWNGEKFHMAEADMGVLVSADGLGGHQIAVARQIDMLIENAGVWLRHYAETADGLEQSLRPMCWAICAAARLFWKACWHRMHG